MVIAPRYNCFTCWHCWNCWHYLHCFLWVTRGCPGVFPNWMLGVKGFFWGVKLLRGLRDTERGWGGWEGGGVECWGQNSVLTKVWILDSTLRLAHGRAIPWGRISPWSHQCPAWVLKKEIHAPTCCLTLMLKVWQRRGSSNSWAHGHWQGGLHWIHCHWQVNLSSFNNMDEFKGVLADYSERITLRRLKRKFHRLVMAAAAKSNLKRVALELGGKSPLVVMDDCDLEKAVRTFWKACFPNFFTAFANVTIKIS